MNPKPPARRGRPPKTPRDGLGSDGPLADGPGADGLGAESAAVSTAPEALPADPAQQPLQESPLKVQQQKKRRLKRMEKTPQKDCEMGCGELDLARESASGSSGASQRVPEAKAKVQAKAKAQMQQAKPAGEAVAENDEAAQQERERAFAEDAARYVQANSEREADQAKDKAKEKRQQKAKLAQRKLLDNLDEHDKVEMALPRGHLSSMSWTAISPVMGGNKVGVILYQETFYVYKVSHDMPAVLSKHLQVSVLRSS